MHINGDVTVVDVAKRWLKSPVRPELKPYFRVTALLTSHCGKAATTTVTSSRASQLVLGPATAYPTEHSVQESSVAQMQQAANYIVSMKPPMGPAYLNIVNRKPSHLGTL